VRRALITALLAAAALQAAACLGGLGDSRAARSVALAPEAALELAVRADQADWLLRSQGGWCGARSVRFGGDSEDPAAFEVHAVLFRSVAQATHAYTRLTPEYLALIYRDRMTRPPRPFAYPEALAGDASATTLYGVRLPPPFSAEIDLSGQLTTLRAGRVVLLLDSVGVTPDRFVPAVERLARAASALDPAAC